MNHCLIQAVINSAPQMRYKKENQTPIAEMIVNFKGLRSEDPTRDLKIIAVSYTHLTLPTRKLV